MIEKHVETDKQCKQNNAASSRPDGIDNTCYRKIGPTISIKININTPIKECKNKLKLKVFLTIFRFPPPIE